MRWSLLHRNDITRQLRQSHLTAVQLFDFLACCAKPWSVGFVADAQTRETLTAYKTGVHGSRDAREDRRPRALLCYAFGVRNRCELRFMTFCVSRGRRLLSACFARRHARSVRWCPVIGPADYSSSLAKSAKALRSPFSSVMWAKIGCPTIRLMRYERPFDSASRYG
jgi:hypothetical protein